MDGNRGSRGHGDGAAASRGPCGETPPTARMEWSFAAPDTWLCCVSCDAVSTGIAIGIALTTQLSGRPQPPFHAAEHSIHCEDGAPTMNYGPLQRVVRLHACLFAHVH